MKNRKVRITVWYFYTNTDLPILMPKESPTTTFVIAEHYLLEFLQSLIRADIARVEVEEYKTDNEFSIHCDTKKEVN